jgi:two-component system chemotaxis response regulator CheV
MILAADDSSSARMLLSQAFDTLGAPFLMKKTGLEAWQYLQEVAAEQAKLGRPVSDRIAMVVTDLEMPEMDGFTLTRNIKNDNRLRDIPVVIHSSLSGATNENHVKSAGADAYIAKFNLGELSSLLSSLMRKKAAA